MSASEFNRQVVLNAAKATALWSTPAEEEDDYEMLDEVFNISHVEGEAEVKLIELIDKFFEKAGDLLDGYPMDAAQIGHDLILTTNGHGAGFWDRGLGELGQKLTAVCEDLDEYTLYVGDDGNLYV